MEKEKVQEVQFVKITDIVIKEDRFRQLFTEKNLTELQDSISSGPGLINAVTVKPDMELNTGESRLKAITILHDLGLPVKYHGKVVPEGYIPAIIVENNLSTIDFLKAELHENTHRENFTFLEEANAIAKIARLEQAIINEEKAKSEPEQRKQPLPLGIPLSKISPQAIQNTAEKVFDAAPSEHYKKQVKDSLIMVNALEKNPELADKLKKATSMTEAQKILAKSAQTELRETLAVAQGKNFSSKMHTLIHGDCLEEMAKLPEKSFDVCLTDPIYGVNAGNFGDSGGRMSNFDHTYNDSPENFKEIMPKALRLVSKLLKDKAHIYLACDLRHYFFLRETLLAVGDKNNPWRIPNAPFIQYKLAGGRVPVPGYTPRRSYEVWLYAYRGEKQEYKLINDVIECTSDRTETHGAGKPKDLLKTFLSRSCMPGDKVIDFMAGSCGIIPACHELKLHCTAIEIEAAYYGRGLERIKELR